MKTIRLRECALAWWNELSHQEAYQYYQLWYNNTDNKRKWNFIMVCMSSSTIELLYQIYKLEVDVKF